jgi:hypothetical protein
MSVQEIELAVQQLSSSELARFRQWFAEYDWQEWDAQLEKDVSNGKLDSLAAEALDDLHHGRCRDL